MEHPKVLIVDDDPDICDFVEWGLADRGYEVMSAGNGMEALEKIAAKRPGAIILDMLMPVMNGREFVRAYRELPGPHAPIVVMTAYLDPAAVAKEVGAQGYISKPFDLVTLVDILRGCMPK
jgi:two-component system response regulator MprA